MVHNATLIDPARHITYKPLDNRTFIADLASCRAIMATTGNQLIGEAIHFGKPILGIPIACLEQRLNARQIERMGIGMAARRDQVDLDLLRQFLSQSELFARNAGRQSRDGAREAVEAIERYARELTSPSSGSPPAASPTD